MPSSCILQSFLFYLLLLLKMKMKFLSCMDYIEKQKFLRENYILIRQYQVHYVFISCMKYSSYPFLSNSFIVDPLHCFYTCFYFCFLLHASIISIFCFNFWFLYIATAYKGWYFSKLVFISRSRHRQREWVSERERKRKHKCITHNKKP